MEKQSNKSTIIHIIPQSHIDLAWFWKFEPETTQVCCKLTFGQATQNMDQYPDYTFSQSQVPLYQATEKYHPEIFAKIQKYIKEGRWEIVGGMWVEAEGGEPSGEALVRQCVMGKRFFKERFGIDVTTGWQEDSWSHPWQLVQIYKKCGIDAYFYKRGRRPSQIFWWEGPDGSRILAIKPLHLLTGAVHLFDRLHLNWWLRVHRNDYHIRNVMVRIGKGDHGGGPGSKEIAKIHQFARKNHPNIQVRFNSFRNYLDEILKEPNQFPTVKYEIGNELQGDLTNCCEIKQRNRFCEDILLTAEKFVTIAAKIALMSYPAQEFYEGWEKVLFNQFHDIIGGSAIAEENIEVHQRYDRVKEIAEKTLKTALDHISKFAITQHPLIPDAIPILVFNPLGWKRRDIVSVEVNVPNNINTYTLIDALNHQLPFQVTNSKPVLIKFIGEIKSLGYDIFFLVPNDSLKEVKIPPSQINTSSTPHFENYVLENDFFTVIINPSTGNIAQIIDKRNNSHIFDDSKRGNCLMQIDDKGDSEGRFKLHSDIFPKPLGKRSDIVFNSASSKPNSVALKEIGPIQTTISIHKTFRNSKLIQEITLYHTLPRIDCCLKMDWHETQQMIKLIFPLALKNPKILYSTPYGSIPREADGLEYPMLRWVDLSTETYGTAILNNARNAADVKGSTIGISVLRSPITPMPNSDQGAHYFSYSIFPYVKTGFSTAQVIREADGFNIPLIAIQIMPHEGRLPHSCSFLEMSALNVNIEVLKKAYDSNDWILRLYETQGISVETTILVSNFTIHKAYETDMLENNGSLISFDAHSISIKMTPYEIKTLKIIVQ